MNDPFDAHVNLEISEDSNQHRPSPVLRRLPCQRPRRKDDSWQTTPPPSSTSQDSGKVGRQTAPVPLGETERGESEDVGDAILVAEIAETPWSPVTDEESASPDGEGGRRVRQLETAFSEVEVVRERGGEEQAEEDQTDNETSGEGAYKRQVTSDVAAEDTVQLTRSLARKRGQQVTKGLAEKKGLRIRLPKSVNEEAKEVFVKVDREFIEEISDPARRKKILRRKRIWWSSLWLGGRDHPGMNLEKHGDAVLGPRTTPRALGPAEDLSNASYPLSFTHEEQLVKMFVNIQSGEEARDVPGARTALLAEDTSNTLNPTSPVLDEDDMMRMNVPVEDADISQSTPRLSISHSVKIYREDDDHSEQKTSWRNKIKWRSFWLTSDDSGKKIGEPGLDCACRPLVRTSLSPRAQPHDLALSNTSVAAVPWSPENELMKMVLNIEQQKGEQGDNASGTQSASSSEGGYKSDTRTSLREHDNQSGKVKRRSFWSIGNHVEKNIGDDAPCPRTLSPSEDHNNSAHPVIRLPDEEELLKMLVNPKDGGEERKQGVVAVSPDTAKCVPSRSTSDPGKIHRESDELSGKKSIAWPFSWSWSGHLRRMKFRRRLFRLVGGSQSVEIGEKGDDDVSVPRTTPRSEDLSNAATPISPLPHADEMEKFNDVNIEKQETDASNPNPRPAAAAAAAALDAGKERREDDNHSVGKKNMGWLSAMEGDPVMQLMGMPQTFSYNQLSDSTGGFSKESRLGHGGFGSVYRGMLPRYNVPVAVKKINGASAQGEKEFMAEVSIISQLRHRNLIQLLGCCKDEDKFLLVYELMPNGSLDKALFGRPGEDAARLSWEQRFGIVTGTAAALDYLHQGLKQQVIHRDIKASNIMLDEDWSVKLGDFGLARLVDRRRKAAATMVAGTPGYIAPEVFTSGRFTDKTDVFAFGVVALEVACGRPAWAPRAPLEEAVLVNWVWDSVSTGDVLSTVDERLEDYDAYWMKVLLTIGLLCTHPDPLARPSMRRVVQVLAGDVPVPSLPDSKPGPALLQAAEYSSIDESERPCSGSTSASRSQLLDLEITFAQMTGRPPAHSL